MFVTQPVFCCRPLGQPLRVGYFFRIGFSRQRLKGKTFSGLLAWTILWTFGPSVSWGLAQETETTAPTYEADVRPILKAHCFHCHGEQGEQEGGLDLRLRRFLIDGGDSGPAVEPFDSGQSLLYERIGSGEMPPDEKHLSDEEIEIIRRWIDNGAKTEIDEPEVFDEASYFTKQEQEFWSFQPIKSVAIPELDSSGELDSPIDSFILAKLNANHLEFSEEASRRALIRRLYFDLLGVPPDRQAVESFVEDRSPNAYERLVDRLLSSPRYGERWGRHWLDVAGYADSDGYVDADPVREWSYFYRDYVIQAFNDDMPFDQFVTEQLAGDELVGTLGTDKSSDDVRRLKATGFLRMAPDGTGSGGVDQNVARNEVVAETINIVGTSLLGMTVACARCHNHRYDPISQRDYYELRAIFEPALDWKSWRNKQQRQISLYTDEERQQASEVEKRAQEATQERANVQADHITRTLEEELIKAPDDLKEQLREAYRAAANERTDEQKALLKEYPNIQNISNGSLYLYSEQRGRRANEIVAVAEDKEQALIDQVRRQAFEQLEPEIAKRIQAALDLPEADRSPDDLELIANTPAVTASKENLPEFDPEGAALVARYLEMADVCRNTDAKKQLADMQTAINDIRLTAPKEHFIRALTEPSDHQPDTVLFIRGNHTQPGESVTPSGLDVLTRSTGQSAIAVNSNELASSGRRLAYAQLLTSGNHPLVARVIVNRIWMHHFGNGLVRTPGDFGKLGEEPTHPELLDWLSTELMNHDWQIKHLQRLILLSKTYRQSSARTAHLDELDPDNRLLARQSMKRLESEAIRDAMLEVSGRMIDQMYGEPIPVMEDSVGQIVIGREDLDGERKPRAGNGLGGQEYRRSVYIQVRRSRPLAALETFDVASVAPNCTQRIASNVATQSLLLINGELIQRFAEAFSSRVISEAGDDLMEQIEVAWEIAYAQPAPESQVILLSEFVGSRQSELQAANPDMEEQEARKQALTIACQAILAGNQFIYID